MVRRLLLLNGIAVLGAVINHSSGWGFTAMFWWTDRYLPGPTPNFSQLGSISYYGLRLLEQSIMFSIPAFLFVSGFFIAFATGRGQDRPGGKVVGSRIKSLLFPYLLWSLAIFGWRALEGTVDTPTGYFKQLLFGGAAAPYYYVPLLIQYLLLSFLLVPLIKHHGKLVLLIVGSIQVIVQLARYPVLLGWKVEAAAWIVRYSPGFSILPMIFWFALGIYAGFHLPALKGWLEHWKRILPAITVILALLAFAEWEFLFKLSGASWLSPTVTIFDSLYSGAFILTFLAWGSMALPFDARLSGLGTKSFGVYLMHAPVLELGSRALYHLSPWVLAHQAAFQALLIVIGVAIPLLVMGLVDRSPVRAYYSYIFG
ncbi:MAG: acyltransferase [Acidobacteriota bacterium]